MDVATIRDAGQRETRVEQEQFAAASGPGAVAEAAWKPVGPSREEIAEKYREWNPLPQTDLPGPRATTLAEIRSAVIARSSALRERVREIRDTAPAGEPALLLKAARRWLRPRERHTPPTTAFRVPFTLPETPSPAEMTIIETPFRIPRYMDHPEWRPC